MALRNGYSVCVEGLGKEYQYAERGGVTKSLRDSIARLRSPADVIRSFRARPKFWALKDVEFEVRKGQALAIIGRNGAGKSTLLKILSRITDPTTGRAYVGGRLASLLEVGTGFHPELTGRENIYLNATILGMRRRETAQRFNDIVAFSGVEKFIDTEVKHYSSGMYVRLAFAVAAHVEADVLLVDEVLAVGDAEFQRRCAGKMAELKGSGRTVIFVSHNTVALEALCDSALLLRGGRVQFYGGIRDALREYQSDVHALSESTMGLRNDRAGDGRIRIVDFWLEDAGGYRVTSVRAGSLVKFCFAYKAGSPPRDVYFAFDLRDGAGDPLICCNTADVGRNFPRLEEAGVIRCAIARFPVRAGRFVGNVFCSVGGQIADWVQAAMVVNIEDGDFYGTGSLRTSSKVLVDHSWEAEFLKGVG